MTMETISTDNAIFKNYGLDLSALCLFKIHIFEKGDFIFTQGGEVTKLYIVQNGKVKVTALAANGKDLTLSYYVTEGILGDVEFLRENKSATATSIAIAQTVCIEIPLQENYTYLTTNIFFMNKICLGLSNKLLNSSNNYIASALHSGEERLCTYISHTQRKGKISEPLTEISPKIGISYRHLLRILKFLCENEVLRKSGSEYLILDNRYISDKTILEISDY